MQLQNDIDVREASAPIANASNTDSNSDRIDTANCEGVIFIQPIEDSAATGVATLKIEQNDADSDTGMAALSGISATAICTTNDDLNGKLLIVGVHRPRERYVQAVRTSATANIAFGTCIAVLYGERIQPPTEHSTILDSAYGVSPAEV